MKYFHGGIKDEENGEKIFVADAVSSAGGRDAGLAAAALEGNGTEEEPYRISSAEDLLALGGQACSGAYELTADLDLEGQTMVPIRSLSGSFDGNGHTIRGLTLQGIIRQCYTTMDVRTKSYCAGGFAGWADTSGEEACVFEDCLALGNVSAENGWSGGFVGRINSSDVRFTNCYAANVVTSEEKPERTYGFAGALGSEAYNDILETEGGFNITLTQENFSNCFYNRDLTGQDNAGSFAGAKTADEMKSADFAAALGEHWVRNAEENSGFPYLKELPAPANPGTAQMTVELLVSVYDTDSYQYQADTGVIPVTLESTGNTRVLDVLEAAQEQGLLTYTYTVTAAFGSFVESINGHALHSPDGWMFTVNDKLSNLSASLASVKDGDQILWYEGRTQNQFRAPSWASLTGGASVDDSSPGRSSFWSFQALRMIRYCPGSISWLRILICPESGFLVSEAWRIRLQGFLTETDTGF